MNQKLLSLSLIVLLVLMTTVAYAADSVVLRPYVLDSNSSKTIEAALPNVKASLAGAGFQVVGEYSAYPAARILAVTSDELKKAASLSEFGGYGAAVRVALTQTGDKVQVSHTNPLYMAQVYRMGDGLTGVADALSKALGGLKEFGSEKGIKAEALRDYHYMVMMPYFTDQVRLAKFGSQEEALKAVEAGLDAHKGGTAKVYRVDLPGKSESVFGVAIAKGDGADADIMKVVDMAELKHTAHLPYEMLVSGGTVYMLHGKFRIAQSFPDLTMGTFMKISGAPGAIEDTLEAVVK